MQQATNHSILLGLASPHHATSRVYPQLLLVTCGADDGIRTRDPHLGKVVLYQLSHVRKLLTELLPEV
jgi:hypothetical protein